MRFTELSTWVPRVERELANFYRAERRSAGIFAPYVEALEEFTLRSGKRFRALLVLAGFHIATGRAPTPALPAAAALEHFQSWMLVHDDIIDRAETRRGGPSLHRLLEREHDRLKRSGDRAEYGRAMGITLGDLEEPFTVRSLFASRFPAERKVRAMEEYARMARDTAFGQLLDVRLSGLPLSQVTEEDVLTVHRLKTAAYTVVAPLRIGAVLGGAPERLLRDFRTIGEDLGIAFQLRDDILGVGFDDGKSGKSANDLAEGKRTLLLLRAWQSSGVAERAVLERVMGHPDASLPDQVAARELLRTSGSLARSEKQIDELAARAAGRLARSRAIPARGKPLLSDIADRLVHRAA
jgi:geranylgeranyl diphosphate synthase, type I